MKSTGIATDCNRARETAGNLRQKWPCLGAVGYLLSGRLVRIMGTLPSAAASDVRAVGELAAAKMHVFAPVWCGLIVFF